MRCTYNVQTACFHSIAAWVHWSSESAVFVMRETHWRRIPSIHVIRVGCNEQGEERSMWRMFGVPTHDFNRTRASWAEMPDNLLTAVNQSEQLFKNALSKAASPISGALNNTESVG